MKTKMSLVKRASVIFLSLAVLFTFMPMLPAMHVYADEPGTSMETADPLAVGTAKTEQTVVKNEKHWFSFKTTEEEAYYTVHVDYTGGYPDKPKVSVSNQAGAIKEDVTEESDFTVDSKYSTNYKLAKNTTYYICVEPMLNWNVGPLTFTIKVTKFKDDAGNKKASSAKLQLGTNKGKFEIPQDTDWFKMTTPATGNYTFTYRHGEDWVYNGVLEYNSKSYEFFSGALNSSDAVTVGLNKGKNVYFKASLATAADDNKYSLRVSYKPYKTAIKSISKSSKGFTVKWGKKKKSAASGYQIQYATNSKFTKNKGMKTISKYGKDTCKVTKLKGNKKYYVRMRTYKTINGKKYYSKWSKVKTVTTKK